MEFLVIPEPRGRRKHGRARSDHLPDLARGIREFLACLDSYRRVLEYTALHAGEWAELRGYLVKNVWDYYLRWLGLYRKRFAPLQWAIAGFALPARYYKRVAWSVFGAGASAAL